MIGKAIIIQFLKVDTIRTILDNFDQIGTLVSEIINSLHTLRNIYKNVQYNIIFFIVLRGNNMYI